jgi:DNA-binding transcriptional LysR family regulator
MNKVLRMDGGFKRPIDVSRFSHIASFVSVAEHGSFSAAAAAVDTSPSTVSRKVSQLEELLGVRLLERTTRNVALTEAGRIYHGMCQEILERITHADATMAAMRARPTGTLRISAPIAFGRLHVSPILPEFIQAYPEVQIEADFTDRFVDLIDEGYDAVVRIGALVNSSLVARKLAHNRRIVVAAPKYLQGRCVPFTPLDLKEHDCLCFTRHVQPSDQWTFSRDDKNFTVKISSLLRSDNSDAIHLAALRGAGIALVAAYMCQTDIQHGKLVELLPDWQITPESSIYVAFPSRQFLPPKVRVFADFISAKLKKEPWH